MTTSPALPTAVRLSSPPVRLALAGAAALLLAACMPADAGTAGGSAPPQSAAVISVRPDGAKDWRPDRRVQVAVVAGTLQDVTVTSADGRDVRGKVSRDGTRWTSKKPMLGFGTRYVVKVRAVDSEGLATVTRSTFRTEQPKSLVHSSILPGSGATVGVGMPVIVTFDAPVPNRAAAEQQLSVKSSPAQPGGWYWVSDTMVRYRPKTYWEAGTKVTVSSDLADVRLGDGVWGDDNDTVTFGVGDAMISTVDIGQHQLTVRRNGEVLRTIPITTGKTGWDTRQGVKVIISKDREVVMDAATLEVPKNSPDYYRLNVEYAMRVTWSGEYLHAAPWSVADQGHANVSHGCTGMSTADAVWFYDNSTVGDVVDYVDGVRSMEAWNGYTDWNLSWAQWKQGSALR